MFMAVVYKVMMFVLMFAILFVLKDIISIVKALINNSQVQFSTTHNIYLGLSLSYILTIIFSGISF